MCAIVATYLIGNLYLGFAQGAVAFILPMNIILAINPHLVGYRHFCDGNICQRPLLLGTAWAYTDGMAALAIHVNYTLVIFICASIFIPFFYNSGVVSIYVI